MATAQKVIDSATSLLRVRSAGVSYVDDDSAMNAEAFSALQDFIAQWGEDGLLNIPAPTATTDTLEVSDGTFRALNYNFAIDAAPLFGRSVTPEIAQIAKETKDFLEADISIDISITHESILTGAGRYNINTDR